MSTMIERMRQCVKERSERTLEEILEEAEKEWGYCMKQIYVNSKTATTEQAKLAGAIYTLTQLGGVDLDIGDYLPIFVCPIEVVQSLSVMMWDGVHHTIGREFTYSGVEPDTHERLFSQIETALRVRRREWTEEFKNERHQSLICYFMMWTIVDEQEDPVAWKPEFITPITPPEWWVSDQLHRTFYDERRELASHFQDLWTWENPSTLNRYLWQEAERFAKEQDSSSFIDDRMIGYYQSYEKQCGF
jgi:hypothetical protein